MRSTLITRESWACVLRHGNGLWSCLRCKAGEGASVLHCWPCYQAKSDSVASPVLRGGGVLLETRRLRCIPCFVWGHMVTATSQHLASGFMLQSQ